jgi:hypothetical protein
VMLRSWLLTHVLTLNDRPSLNGHNLFLTEACAPPILSRFRLGCRTTPYLMQSG